MSGENTASSLNALFKEVYGDKLINLIPKCVKACKKYKFQEGKKIGDKYVVPVIVSNTHGFTRGSGALTLNDAINSEAKEAQLQTIPAYLREIVSYDAAAKMIEGKQSFAGHSKYFIKLMYESMYKRQEIEFFYGQKGLVTCDGSTNTDATTTVVDATAATWAAGHWTGAENAKINFFQSVGGSRVGSGAFTISAIDSVTRKITLTGASGDISALDTRLGSATAVAFWSDSGATHASESAGMDKIITNTGSLFNINAATYNLWKGQSYAVGGALTRAKVKQAVAQAVNYGLVGDCTLWINSDVFADLEEGEGSLIRYDGKGKERKIVTGFKEMAFQGQTGLISLQGSPMVKQGDGFVIPDQGVVRTGATDVTFKLPGRKEGEIFLHKDGITGYEIRSMNDQAQMLESPAQAVKLTGIT